MTSKLPPIINPQEIEKLSSQSSFMQMEGGRKLYYYQYGAKNGIPTFYCHGTGSHIQATCFHKAAKKFGYRLVVPDRPGIGLSDFNGHGKILDDARDIAHLADHLGIDKFGVIGLSGGGPTFFACAYLFPKRLKFAVAMACATPQYTDPVASKKLGLIDRVFAKLGAWLPLCLFQIPWIYLRSLYKRPQSFITKASSSMCQADREVMKNKNFQRMFMLDGQEMFRRGLKGAAFETQRVYHPWGFNFRDIKCHVDIRQGSADRWVPPSFSEYAEKAIPNATLHVIQGQGHFYHLVYSEEVFKMLKARN